MESILYRLKKLRKEELKISQEEFGAKINLSKSNISNIEIGRIGLTDRNIDVICNTFNVRKEWLTNGTGEIFEELPIEEQIAEFVGNVLNGKEDSFKKRYIEMLSKLDDDGWEALERVAESFLSLKNG